MKRTIITPQSKTTSIQNWKSELSETEIRKKNFGDNSDHRVCLIALVAHSLLMEKSIEPYNHYYCFIFHIIESAQPNLYDFSLCL